MEKSNMPSQLHDNAEAKVFTPQSVESSRLVVSNSEMAMFQGNRSISSATTIAEREQSMFGNGLDFSQLGNIYGQSGDNLLAYKNQQTDTSDKTQIADKPHEKPKESDIPAVCEPGHPYDNPEQAAKAALYDRHIVMKSAKPGERQPEYGGLIYQRSDGKFSYTTPVKGEHDSFGAVPTDWQKSIESARNDPKAQSGVGWYHTHPYSGDPHNLDFSPADREIINGSGSNSIVQDNGEIGKLPGYLRNYQGDIVERMPGQKTSKTIYHAAEHHAR